MKSIFIFLFTLSLVIGVEKLQAYNVSQKGAAEMLTSNTGVIFTDMRAQQLMARLNEISDLDKSQLTRQEKRNLRKEVINIKEQLNKKQDVIYISAAALIIIVLLIILL